MINLALLDLDSKALVIMATINLQILVMVSHLVQQMISLKTFSLILDLKMMMIMTFSLVKKEKRINLDFQGLSSMEGLEGILEWEEWVEDRHHPFRSNQVVEGLVEVGHQKACLSLLK